MLKPNRSLALDGECTAGGRGAADGRGVAAAEAAYRAELGWRPGRVWVALDAHQVPYWGRGQRERFQKGWSGSRSRRLRGYRLYLAVDCDAGQVVTFLLARGRARDARLAALLARRRRAVLGQRLAGVVADCGFTSRPAVTPRSAQPRGRLIPGSAGPSASWR